MVTEKQNVSYAYDLSGFYETQSNNITVETGSYNSCFDAFLASRASNKKLFHIRSDGTKYVVHSAIAEIPVTSF